MITASEQKTIDRLEREYDELCRGWDLHDADYQHVLVRACFDFARVDPAMISARFKLARKKVAKAYEWKLARYRNGLDHHEPIDPFGPPEGEP